jgi:hypothetical protein
MKLSRIPSKYFWKKDRIILDGEGIKMYHFSDNPFLTLDKNAINFTIQNFYMIGVPKTFWNKVKFLWQIIKEIF